MRLVLTIGICFLLNRVGAQHVCRHVLGDSVVHFILENPKADKSVLFVNVHENEWTSVEAMRCFDSTNQYRFLWINHRQTRRIFFNVDTLVYSIDPNRIFTDSGVVKTLVYGQMPDSTYIPDKKEIKIAHEAARQITRHFHGVNWIISLHNNTPDNYSILSYLPGGDEFGNTSELFVNPSMDPDDFIYTTHLGLYNYLKTNSINVILQNNTKFVDDGSLSVYCALEGIPYVNVEAEEGHLMQQQQLLSVVLKGIDQLNP